MALATADTVIEMGALEYELFLFSSKDQLVALVNRWIKVNDLNIQNRAGDFYTSTDPLVIDNLTMGEVFLTLGDVVAQAAARKVYGTHDPIDSEPSVEYFQQLVTYYRERAREFLEDYFVVDTTATSAFAAPVMLIGDPVDPAAVGTQDQILREWLDDARGFSNPEIAPVSR